IDDFFSNTIQEFRDIPIEYIYKPAKMTEFLIDKKVSWTQRKIPNWDLFEVGQKYYEDSIIKGMIYGGLQEQSHLFLLTDEGIKDKILFDIPVSYRFDQFMNDYEKQYKMEFFQPSDYLAFFPNERIINL